MLKPVANSPMAAVAASHRRDNACSPPRKQSTWRGLTSDLASVLDPAPSDRASTIGNSPPVALQKACAEMMLLRVAGGGREQAAGPRPPAPAQAPQRGAVMTPFDANGRSMA